MMKRICISLLLLILCLLLTGCSDLIHIEGSTMEPTLCDEDIVHIEEYQSPDEIGRFDVILMRISEKKWLLVKRVAGLPGDTVELRDGVLYVNGALQEEPWVIPENRSHDNFGPVTVPEGCVFLLGDNRNMSLDSRNDSFGMIPLECVLARVTEVVRPNPRPVQ